MERDYSEEERYLRAAKKVKDVKGFYTHLIWYFAVLACWIAVLLILNDFPSYSKFGFWGMGYGFYATAVFWGVGILAHWFGVFGVKGIFSKKWEERKIKEYMDKEQNL